MEIDLITIDTGLIINSNNNIVEFNDAKDIFTICSKENIKDNDVVFKKMMITTWILH